jgi:hypothetical protein
MKVIIVDYRTNEQLATVSYERVMGDEYATRHNRIKAVQKWAQEHGKMIGRDIDYMPGKDYDTFDQ